MTQLERLIAAIQCPGYSNKICMNCPYDYQIELEDEDRPRHSYYDCDRVTMLDDALIYLKCYLEIINNGNK